MAKLARSDADSDDDDRAKTLATLRKLARLDAEMIASARIGRGGPMHFDSARRACLRSLPQGVLDAYFERVRSRNVPALVVASHLVCGGCRAALEPSVDERLQRGVVEPCPRCQRLMVAAA